jgi:N-formylglutamate amidohydrolase
LTGYLILNNNYHVHRAIPALKKTSHLPILIIIPHGGFKVPEELSGYESVNKFDLFMQSDTCANDLFSYGERVAGTINSDISRLFVDLDRPYTALPPAQDGVIKKSTLYGKPVFRENLFPDEIAISNLLRRYWFPFHDAAKKIIAAGNIKLILECHAMMAVGPKISRDPGKPRPIVRLDPIISRKEGIASTCDIEIVRSFMDHLKKPLAREEETIAEKFTISDTPSGGFILAQHGAGPVPMIRLSISRSLFLNDTYFSYDYLRVDELRIRHLRDQIWEAIEKFFNRNF